MPENDTPDATEDRHRSLRGTFIAVLIMAAFFIVTWFGMYALLLSRR